MIRRGPACGIAFAAVLWSGSCVDIRGGAIELAWQLYRRDGITCCPDGNYCMQSGVRDILVHLEPVTGSRGLTPLDRVFACGQTQATTRFDIPPGRYQITVAGQCANQSIALGPGPAERDIRNGEVTGLGAIALTVDSVDVCCRNAIQQQVCP